MSDAPSWQSLNDDARLRTVGRFLLYFIHVSKGTRPTDSLGKYTLDTLSPTSSYSPFIKCNPPRLLYSKQSMTTHMPQPGFPLYRLFLLVKNTSAKKEVFLLSPKFDLRLIPS